MDELLTAQLHQQTVGRVILLADIVANDDDLLITPALTSTSIMCLLSV